MGWNAGSNPVGDSKKITGLRDEQLLCYLQTGPEHDQFPERRPLSPHPVISSGDTSCLAYRALRYHGDGPSVFRSFARKELYEVRPTLSRRR